MVSPWAGFPAWPGARPGQAAEPSSLAAQLLLIRWSRPLPGLLAVRHLPKVHHATFPCFLHSIIVFMLHFRLSGTSNVLRGQTRLLDNPV